MPLKRLIQILTIILLITQILNQIKDYRTENTVVYINNTIVKI